MSIAMDISIHEHLTSDEVAEVVGLINEVSNADGARPISEHVMLHLRHGGDEHDSHLLARDNAQKLIGYLHLDATDPVAGASAELAVSPHARRQGVGSTLVTMAMKSYNGRFFRLWAHGDDHGAHGLANSLGFNKIRTLFQMRRSLYATLPASVMPDGVTLRSFIEGQDEDAVLAVNNRAFSQHPDQGQWTRQDLDARIRESWFDASGFLIAEKDHQIVGFHWTKVHGALQHSHGSKSVHTHEAIGEVYVLGVEPTWRGTGLGKALTVAGLRHLRSLGLDEAMLYVESDNVPALRLYESLGFTHWDSDVLYRRITP